MAQHVWTVLCNKAIVDERTKQISLFDIAEQINLSGEIPSQDMIDKGVNISAPLTLVSFWTRSNKDTPEKFEIRVTLVGPNEKKYNPGVIQISLEANRNTRQIISMDNIPFTGFGDYYFLLEKKEHADKEVWNEVARAPFAIVSQGEKTGTKK